MFVPLLARAKVEGTPLIEEDQVTFIWEGVESPLLIGDITHWGMEKPNLTFDPIATNVWAKTVQVPRDTYFEYRFIVNGREIPDPLNPHHQKSGFGDVNSCVWMPEAVDTPLGRTTRGVKRGKLTAHTIDGQGYVVGSKRKIHLYQPPVDVPVPLMIVFDGAGYLHQAKITTIVDNLIAQRRIQPIALALVHASGHGRTVEYACSDTTTAYIVRCVLSIAQQELHLLDVARHPGAYAMMGASMGGLMSLYIAYRVPEIFGKVLSQSGAFGSEHLYYRSVLNDLIRYSPPPPLKIWLDAGIYEWYAAPNRALFQLLQERGVNATYLEHNSGHNYPSWRNILARGLEHLYGHSRDKVPESY